MRLSRVVDTWTRIAATRSRTEKTRSLAELLADLAVEGPDALRIGTTWLTGELVQGKIGVGPSLVWGARDTEPAASPSLELDVVHTRFDALRDVAGAGAKGRREALLRDLLGRATADEQRFLGSLLVGELRQGALEGVLADAVAKAFDLEPRAVRRAAMRSGDLAAVALAVQCGGADALAGFRLELFRPVQPMLADTAASVEDAIERLGTAAFETKLDGVRIQVHRDGDRVRAYTRHLREVTASVPEVVEVVRGLPVTRVVLDGEVLSLHPDGRPRPFQETMRRLGRDGSDLRDEIPLHPWFFDALLVDDTDLLDRPWSERSARLSALVPDAHVVPRRVTSDPEAAAAWFDEVLDQGHEGVVAKDPEAPYEAGRRGSAWLKLKAANTLDLVVVAVEWGSGRRQGWLSNLHLACRHGDGFVMLGKTFKGLSDALLRWQTERFLALETSRSDWVVHVRPEQVVEVAFNEIQVSPRYPGGLALRFARVVRYREDKAASEADTLDAVRELHARMVGSPRVANSDGGG